MDETTGLVSHDKDLQLIKKKREAIKALNLLGVDPSKEKLKTTLGVDEATLEEALEETLTANEREREEEILSSLSEEERKLIRNRKQTQKALAFLGLDPSKQKLMDTLGLTEMDLLEALEDVKNQNSDDDDEDVEYFSGAEEDDEEVLKIKNRKRNLKAFNLLGINPSRFKLMETLGLDEEGLEDAQKEAKEAKLQSMWERVEEEREESERQQLGAAHRKALQKAFAVLGIDPSEKKIMETLGIDRETLEEAKRQALARTYYDRPWGFRFATSRGERRSLLATYGFDSSQEKMMDILGIDDETVQRAIDNERRGRKSDRGRGRGGWSDLRQLSK
eukprot:TRINITY_DN3629_c0_g5_i1.p1 TRINITY_DN3629_c0_g5~~TRINITY_DN3629_c0_g5_i1.p1  ORF type:complete len:345 (-),score=122.49 TRINITY_DN3629_c0_g5_i1:546-1547(-)